MSQRSAANYTGKQAARVGCGGKYLALPKGANAADDECVFAGSGGGRGKVKKLGGKCDTISGGWGGRKRVFVRPFLFS